MESIFGEDPAIIIEHRSLFELEDAVPDCPYRVRYGQAIVRKTGADVTLVAIGYMVLEALKAAVQLEAKGIGVEVIDPRTLTPLDRMTICSSVHKTGRLVVVDPGWYSFGAAAEIISSVCEEIGNTMKAKPIRVTLPDSHTPMSMTLERAYYPGKENIIHAVNKSMSNI
jgi:pyruvate dehydrogenase E1 component beta subunit